jgi:hypothetical protein
MNFMHFGVLFASASAVLLDSFVPEGLVNQQVKRVIYLSSPVLREEYSIVAALDENTAGPVYNYQVILPTTTVPQFSHISAIGNTGPDSRLPITEKTDCPIGHRCFVINFPTPLTKSNPKVSFGLGISYTDRFVTTPSVADQKTPLGVRCEMSPVFYSPYPTLRQKTEVLIIKEFNMNMISCPEPRSLKGSTVPAGGPLPGTMYTCGIYENVVPLHDAPGSLWFHFTVTKLPFYKIQKLERTVEINPLKRQLLVTEEYEIVSLGHKTKDSSFNRIEFLQGLHQHGMESQILPLIPISAPSQASEFQVRDEVGLIHSPTHRRPSPVLPTSHVIEVPPRFPVSGGWNMAWTVTYSLPMEDFIDNVFIKEEHLKAKRIIVPLFDIYNDVTIEEFKFRIILPAGSTAYGAPIVTAVDSFISAKEEFTIPMPLFAGDNLVFSINIKNVAKDHLGHAAMIFDYPRWTVFRLPVMTAAICILVVLLLIQLGEANFGLHRVGHEKSRLMIAKLFRERRGLLHGLESVRSEKENAQACIGEIVSVSEEVARVLSEEEPTDRPALMATAALKKLYEEQLSKLRSLISEPSANIASRLEKDAVDLDERVLQCEARLLTL